MTGISRRSLITGVGAPLGLAFCGAPVLAANPVAIPDRPMHLSRRLERGLRNGQTIVVERSWQIEFDRQGRGISVSGAQLSAQVDAPTELATLALIEEARSTADMWPILLSSNGRIVAAGRYTHDEDVAAAVREAEAIVAGREGKSGTKAQLSEYLRRMQQASTSLLEQLPPDLFFPEGGKHEIAQPVSLPGGLKGEFIMIYTAQRAASHKWLGTAQRQIVTRIGDDERRSLESWEMHRI